jgi:hypothetical protein
MPLVHKREFGQPYYRWSTCDMDAYLGTEGDHIPLLWVGNAAALRKWLAFQAEAHGSHVALRGYGAHVVRDKYNNPTRRTRYWSFAPGRTGRASYNDWTREHEVIGDLIETVDYAPVPPPPPPPPLKVGERIWRPAFRRQVDLNTYKILVDEPSFEQKDGCWMFRACRNDDVAPADREVKPGIIARWLRAKDEPHDLWTASLSKFGLVCFSREEVPRNWTYFEVTGLAQNNHAAFVKPVAGAMKELLAQYKVE